MDDYVKREQELGAKCLFGGEHGNQGNFAENYFLAKKNNLKYVHSAEAYWVKNRHEKDRTNCHICIIALNNRARQELNYILSIANEDGYYGKPRIDLELILSLNPEDFIITSACLQGWKYDDADEIWLKIANHFGTNFFLEVQNHNTEKQKELNRHILSLAKEYDLQIICGLDSHYISVEKDEERRNEYLKYKKMNYPEEDGWYLDYPDGKTIYKRFKEQGVLSDEEILYSMMNTQVFNVKCEEIVIDNTFKIPILYKDKTFDERVQILKSHLNKAYKKEKLKSKEKIEGIKWETEQIVDSKVMDYFLTNEAIISDAINNEGGILTTTSRGSSASFIINKLLGFTTLDRFNSEIPIYPERFLTKERISAGQMPDIDFNVSSQEPFVRAAKKIVGENGCYPLMAVEKMSEKSAWQLYASVSGVAPIIANQISKYLDSYNETIKHLETEEEKKDIKVEDYIPKEYISIYNKSKEYQSIIVNLKVHACGFLLFDGDLRREFGLISAISQTTKKRTLCVAVEGKYLDDLGYVKNDFLIVDSVGVANECFQSIGQKVPTTEELKTLISKDNKTWQIYEYGITQCVNQVEQEKTKQKIVKYKPQTVSELAAFIAGIRPGFSSLLPTFLDRQYYSTGEDKIDEVLKDSYHYMIYQESIMKVLSFLQMPMASTYDVVKSISKKKLKGKKKEKLKNELKQSWMNIFGNTKNFEKIWQVINDAASYSFNCLSENTIIYSPNHKKSAKLLTIGDMYRICHDYQYAKETRHLALHKKYKYNGYGKTLSLFQDGKLHYNDILEIYDAGIQDTYTVTTKTGKTIDCTMEHKFPTPKGKLPLKELKIGDKFYVKPDFIGICFDGIPVYEDEIISIEYKTKEQVYNVSMADPAHNFVVNDGIVTSNSPHALSMAFDSLYLAYFKSHYTSKFYETTINHYFAKGNKDKINKLTLEAEEFYYYENKIPKFGKNYDTAIVEDDTKYIYPILSSIKSMQNIANDILYQISKKNPDDFLELLYMTEQIKVNGKKINKTSMEILIKLGFFDKFGDVNYLLEYYSIFQKYFGKTQVKKQDFGYSLSNNIIKKETEKTIFIYDSCMMIDEIMQQINIKDCTLYQKSYYQLKSLGYTDIHIDNAGRDVYMVMGIEKNKYGTPFAQLYKPKNGKSQLIKLDKKWYSKYPIEGGEVLRCEFEHKNKSRKDERGNWYKTDEKEWILKRYSILTKLEE
jgi:DNA polymerase III alpha subunit